MLPVHVSPDLPQALLATVAVRATVILLAAWLLTLALRRSAAAARHVVWSVALATLMLLPLVSALLPRWDASRAQPASAAPAMPANMAAPVSAPSSFATPAQHDHSDAFAAPASPRRPVLPAAALLMVWALGAAFGIGRLSAGWAAARRLVRRAFVPADDRATLAVRELAGSLGIDRDVRVLISPTLSVPVNCGLFSPVVVLPASAEEWSDERLRVVLLHELAHVRRWDYASLLVMEAARALYWFNPLVWVAARRANIELERACDDEVLRAGTRSVEYAEHLYQIAASLAGRAPSGALAMAQPSTLRARVGAILAASIDRSPIRLRALAGAAALALLVGIPLASLRLLGEGRDSAEEQRAIRSLDAAGAADRARAAYLLGGRKSSQAVGPLMTRLNDADPSVRGMAAWALGSIHARQAATALEATLHDPDASVREMAVIALGSIGDKTSVSALAILVNDPEMGVRGVLTHALHDIGGAEAGAVLSGMVLHDSDAHVRDMSTWALRLTLGRDAVPTLLVVLRDPDSGVRGSAARNLYELPDARAFEALASAATRDESPMVRANATWALGALKDTRAAGPLVQALRDTVWNVRVAAAGALGQTPGQDAADALIAATRDPVHQVRLTAIESLGERDH